MADTAIANVDNSKFIGTNLADLFLGKSTTTTQTGGTTINSGGTQTTTEEVSADKTNAIIKSILEGTQGLSSVASGQKSAGLYNSTTNRMLINDLLSRAGSQAAAASKTTTQTISPSTVTKEPTQSTVRVQPQVNTGTALAGLAALQLIPSDVKAKILDGIGIGGKAAAGAKIASGVPTNSPIDAVKQADEVYQGSSAASAGSEPIAASESAPAITAEVAPAAPSAVDVAGTVAETAGTTATDVIGAGVAGDIAEGVLGSEVIDAGTAAAGDLALGEIAGETAVAGIGFDAAATSLAEAAAGDALGFGLADLLGLFAFA